MFSLLHGGTFTITSSTFTHNTANQDGGVSVIYSGGTIMPFNIMNSTVANNKAGEVGGVIKFWSGGGSLLNINNS